MRRLQELLNVLPDDKNDAAYFWDESGEFNKGSLSDNQFVDPNQTKLKFRDISKILKFL